MAPPSSPPLLSLLPADVLKFRCAPRARAPRAAPPAARRARGLCALAHALRSRPLRFSSRFPVELKKQIPTTLKLTNTGAAPVAFKARGARRPRVARRLRAGEFSSALAPPSLLPRSKPPAPRSTACGPTRASSRPTGRRRRVAPAPRLGSAEPRARAPRAPPHPCASNAGASDHAGAEGAARGPGQLQGQVPGALALVSLVKSAGLTPAWRAQVQSVVVPPEAVEKLTKEAAAVGALFEPAAAGAPAPTHSESRLKVAYITPPPPPSPVMEEGGGGAGGGGEGAAAAGGSAPAASAAAATASAAAASAALLASSSAAAAGGGAGANGGGGGAAPAAPGAAHTKTAEAALQNREAAAAASPEAARLRAELAALRAQHEALQRSAAAAAASGGSGGGGVAMKTKGVFGSPVASRTTACAFAVLHIVITAALAFAIGRYV